MPSPLDLARRLKHQAFLQKKGRELTQESRALRATERFSREYEMASRGIVLPDLPAMSGPCAIAMVREEADVIERSVRHLADQGIPHIVVVDNGSKDATPDILRRLTGEIPGLVVGADREPAYVQSAKMTRLADLASAAGATWVVPFDADELWFGAEGTLAEALAAADAPVLRAVMHNAFPAADGSGPLLDTTAHFDVKVAFRPRSGAVLEMGNHEVLRPGVRAEGLRILHLPWRSFEQFARKSRTGAQAIALADTSEDKAYHWRRLGALDDDALRAAWEALLAGQPLTDAAWYPRGTLRPLRADAPTRWDEV
ncbi:glycosyltransferase family 2 protein [Micrococcus endophyticus]|uniref:Glycosyltransferase family 2 protein n=1 Tax=Micrococcus endophyticus TaxID=455343 RepID=A0A7W9N0Z0_9MICC|nr:glycosyltransferase family 2 protein [Micrococcus endophyticus]MBB5848789.1 hypothetical protein [Micrococcus endophyticus]